MHTGDFVSHARIVIAFVLPFAAGCGGAIWDQRSGAFNDALASDRLEVGKIPTDFGAEARKGHDDSLGPDLPIDGTAAEGSAGNHAHFVSYDEKTRRVCFDRRNAHDLIDDSDVKKYFAKEKRPETYVIDVWDSLENLAKLSFPPRGFGASPVEVTEKDGGSYGSKYAVHAGGGTTKVRDASVWAIVKICAVLSQPLEPGRFVTLSRAEMKQPGFEVENIPSEVFAWKVTDEEEGKIGLGASKAPPVEAPAEDPPSPPEPVEGEAGGD